MRGNFIHLLGDFVDDGRRAFSTERPSVIVNEELLFLAFDLPPVKFVQFFVVLFFSLALFTDTRLGKAFFLRLGG